MPSKRKSSQFSEQAVKQQQLQQELHQAVAFSLSAFDNDSSTGEASSSQYFAVVAQGVDAFRLRIWDTRTSSLAAEHVVPAGVTCTAVAWGSVGEGVDGPEKKKKRRRSGAVPSQSHKVVAIGLSTGEVQLYSLAHGKVVRTLAGAHTASVSDFAFAGDGVKGYSGGLDGIVVEWDVRTGTELGRFVSDGKPVRRVRVSHDCTRLISAGHAIKLWNIGTREVIRTYPGHASEVIRIKFSPNDSFCVTAAEDDRHISVWDTGLEGTSDHVTSLTMDSAPTNIAISGGNQVLALTEEGIVYLWDKVDQKDGTTPVKKKKKQSNLARPAQGLLSIVSSLDKDAKERLPILTATFSDEKILVARGNVVKPIFERVEYLSDEGKLIEKTTLSRKPVTSLLVDEEALVDQAHKDLKTRYKEDDVLVLGAADLPADSNTIMADPDMLTRDEQAALKEPTLEERLSAMVVTPASEAKPGKPARPPTANSLHQMLSQAIHTNDVHLLEQALQVHDTNMIVATVRRLPPSQVLPLLDQLMLRLQRRPNRARELIEWVRAVVLVHAGYLMSVPNLAANLGALYQTIDSRASVFQKLLRLSGRLDLVVSQIALRNRAGANGEVQEDEALVVYDEEDEEEEDGDEDAVDGMDVEEVSDFEDEEDDDESDYDDNDDEEASDNPEGEGSDDGDGL
ncbi:hypothetical protein SpCBS45565_g07046 [Spizellomyces sp. 'palustris']|nr:hypothetical protein SpCBS45565_g07046 [Spizellomyces sp. 'palustris']